MGFWRANIGSLEEFWALTPREVHEVVENFWRSQDLEQMRIGTLGAIAINLQLQRGKKRGERVKLRTWRNICPPFTASHKKRGLTIEEMLEKSDKMRREMYAWKY